jgi:hypothetical protein
MKTFKEVEQIVNNISYKNWKLRVLEKGDGFLLQVLFVAKDIKTGLDQEQRCRKWYISSHCCNSEIVRTAFKAIEAAELHELHENFQYKGRRVFDPHIDVDHLAGAIGDGLIGEDIRK